MRKYWIFLLWMAFVCLATAGCGSQGNAVTTPNPTPSPTPTPVPTPSPTPTPAPAATPVTSAAFSTITGSPFIWLPSPGATTVALRGSGFTVTDTQVMTPGNPHATRFVSRLFVSPAEFDLGIQFVNGGNGADFRTGFQTLSDCNASNNTNCSNPPAVFVFLGDGLTRMGMGSDGRFVMQDNGKIQLFSATGAPMGSPFAVGNFAGSVAFDSTRNLAAVASAGAGSVALFDVNNPTVPGHFGPANVTGTVKEVVQLDDVGCAAVPATGIVTIFPMDLLATTSVSSSAGAVGSKPWSVAMLHVGTELDCVSISAGDSKLVWTNTADGSTSGSITLAGITPNGTPRVVAFDSGAQAGTVAVFSPADSLAVLVDSATKTEIRRVVVPSSPASHVVQVAADPTGGSLILVYANINGNVASTTFMKLAVASGAPVPYSGPNSTSNILFMDVAVSPASPTIMGGSLGVPASIPTQ